MKIDKVYLKRVLLFVLIGVAAIVLLVDIVHFLIKKTESSYLTQFPDKITIRLSDQADAMIVRNEFAIEHDLTDKTVLYLVPNGERVEKGAEIAYIYPFSDRADAVEEIEKLDEKIRLCEDVIHESGMYTLPKLTKLIDQTLSEIDSLRQENSFSRIGNLQYRLNVLLALRDIRMGSATAQTYEQQLKSVSEERRLLIDSLGTKRETVTASEAGYFYRGCDGYENAFDVSALSDLDTAEFAAAVENYDKETDKLGKIVRTYTWYAVCKVDAEQANHYLVGRDYTVSFANEPIDGIKMRLYHMSFEYGAESALLVFTSELQPDGFSYERSQHVEVTYESHEGFAIPETAVRVKDGVQGVYVLMGYRVLFRQINPVYEKDGLILADQNIPENSTLQALNFYDNMIVKGSDLHVDKIIE